MIVCGIAWGDVPTWVQAVTTSALLVIAFITLAADRRRMRAIEVEQQAQREENARAQARLVSAWPDEWSAGTTVVRCRNGSFEPIYEVRVELQLGTGERGVKSVGVMRPAEELDCRFDIGPGDDLEPAVEVAFRDAAGRIWRRGSDGILNFGTELLPAGPVGSISYDRSKAR